MPGAGIVEAQARQQELPPGSPNGAAAILNAPQSTPAQASRTPEQVGVVSAVCQISHDGSTVGPTTCHQGKSLEEAVLTSMHGHILLHAPSRCAADI